MYSDFALLYPVLIEKFRFPFLSFYSGFVSLSKKWKDIEDILK